jgi:hypothetical protein
VAKSAIDYARRAKGKLNSFHTFSKAAGVLSTARIERDPSDFLNLRLGGVARLPFTARNFLTRPPTGTPRRAISPSEHIPIVRAPGARDHAGVVSPAPTWLLLRPS